MLETIVTTLVPVAVVVLLGYLAGRQGNFQVADRALLTKLVLSWLLPPLLLGGILKTPRADLLNYRTPLIFLVGLLVPYLLGLLVCRLVLRYDRGKATIKASLWTFPDMVFMGIPILSRLFGPTVLFPILIANLVPSLIIIPLDTVLLELSSKKPDRRSGTDVFVKTMLPAMREPRVWLPLLGIVLVLTNLSIPKVVISSLDLVGSGTTALSLFLVGLIIAEEKVRLNASVAIDVLLKNLVHPAAMLATVLAFGVTGALAQQAILLAAIPSAVVTTMFAEEYRIIPSEAATTILVTRVLCFVSIPAVMALIQRLGLS